MPQSTPLVWEDPTFRSIPYQVHVDPDLFALEHDRIFRGPFWHYLGLETEIKNPGDFITTYVGTIPVVLTRGIDGELNAFVNRCAHRGAKVVRELRGNCKVHTCIYHQWSYDQTGKLKGVPYRRGINGNGGYPETFNPEDHGLEVLRVESYAGVVFGTFAHEIEAVPDFMGPDVKRRFDKLCGRPLRVTGYQRQSVRGNWKLYVENLKDCYHGALLHAFNSKFGMFRTSQRGSTRMAKDGLHCILTTYGKRDENIGDTYKNISTYRSELQLEDPQVVEYFEEHDDGMVSTVLSLFPTMVLAQIANHLGLRHIRPKSVDEFELVWINFDYEDDSDERRNIRRKQGNLLGPGGYLSMEDAEALEIVHKTLEVGGGKGSAYVEMGGAEIGDQDHLVTEAPVRGFWRGYCKAMSIPVAESAAAKKGAGA